MSAKTKIAIACQGGGSQTAFTAGVLKALCEERIDDEFEIVSLSGTSGGALCAALLWFALEKGEQPAWVRLMNFWNANTAYGWAEETFNKVVVDSLRMANSGLLPTLQFSPYSPWIQMMMGMATITHRESFRNFETLLRTHIDFAEIHSWGPREKRPILMIGAANVLTGKLAKFVSRREAIRPEHLLASCAVPSIFPAVEIGDDAYWDGLFSDNPPVQELINPRTVGVENIPHEIWVIKINQTAIANIPKRPDDIVDRRNQLDGNISLFHQLRYIELINDLLLADAFRPEFLSRLDVTSPIRIPKSFREDDDKPYYIPCIEMTQALNDELDFESKLDRSRANIDRLIAEGEGSARAFLAARTAADRRKRGDTATATA
jgi:NTE family protein